MRVTQSKFQKNKPQKFQGGGGGGAPVLDPPLPDRFLF